MALIRHLLDLYNPARRNSAQTATSYALEASAPAARNKSSRLTMKQENPLELVYILHRTNNQLNHTMEDTQVFQAKTGGVLQCT
jgi:hypothetical protein